MILEHIMINTIIENMQNGYIRRRSGILEKADFTYKRHSKSELNKEGYKLVFLDTNVLSDLVPPLDQLRDDKTRIESQEKIVAEFKKHNFRPVLSLELFAEFIQGLIKRNEFLPRKKAIIKLLENFKPVWILEHQFIEALEYCHLDKNVNPHKEFKIFSNIALADSGNENYKVPYYNCDQSMKFTLIPYESAENWEKFLDELLRDLDDIVKYFQEGCQSNFEATLSKRIKRKGITSEARKIIKRKNNEDQVTQISTKYIKNCDLSKILSALDNCYDNNSINQKAPYHAIYEYIYEYHIDNIKKVEDFIDGLFAAQALSYCDCIITNDKNSKLQSLCLKIIEYLDLKAEVWKFDKDNFSFSFI